MNTSKQTYSALRHAAMLLMFPASFLACGDDGGGTGTDFDASTETNRCTDYCTTMTANCSGDNAQYDDMADCQSYCSDRSWTAGAVDETSGNTLECRIYHAGVAAAGEPAEHCPHAGPTGDGVCGASITFRSDVPAMYSRVDRLGMPAVSTALISSVMKNAYNDADPVDDAAGGFVPDLGATLTAYHDALDTRFDDLSLETCSMADPGGGALPECFTQEIAAGVSVASLVVPDTLQIDPAGTAGFPNGRMLADPVMDVTLAIIFLKMGGTCGTGLCSPLTLATMPLNPGSNDKEFGTGFPYLAGPHTP